ncbi:MAG: class I SAM-dependent methyltransferase, partial [Candidatus Korobacteraceae bacterium]
MIEHFYERSGRDLQSVAWLDVGCGFGELLRLGNSFVREAAGCDVSAEMLERCRDLNVRVQPSPTFLPYPERRFDLITAACVFHHVAHAMRPLLIKEIFRVLSPGGLCCIIEHNPWNPITQLIVRRTPVDTNAHLLTATQAHGLLMNEGLTPASRKYFLLFPECIYEKTKAVEAL